MAVSAPTAPARPSDKGAALRARRPRLDWVFAGALAVLTLALANPTKAHFGEMPTVALATLATLVLFWVSGEALCRLLAPASLVPLRLLLALPLGAIASALLLTALGLAHVPLHVSLWVVLAAGVASTALARRRDGAADGGGRGLAPWLVTLALIGAIALIPAWRTGSATIYGQNPDAHQVAGIAVLFQHVAPTGTDVALPIDTVPGPWRFRYPIFYPLAAASNLSHLDPIRVFAAMAAILLVVSALGFGLLAVRCLRAPGWSGPAVGTAVALSASTLHLVWHPYWNQLWGLAMLPYALLFGWLAIEQLDARAAVLFVLVMVMLGLAYPLALPYPLVIVGALALASWRTIHLPRRLRSNLWVAAVVGVLVLAPAVIGAGIKLEQGLSQLLDSHSALWGGDITHLTPVGKFAGTGGGIVPVLLVAALAVFALRGAPRRMAWAFGVVLALLCLLDLRFRLSRTGAYMDFKHLSFVGALIVALFAITVARLTSSRSSRWLGAGLLIAIAWGGAAAYQDHLEIILSGEQVTPEMFQIRQWAARLPPGASVRVDVPPSGTQLWVVYMLGDHPVDTPRPVRYTTYAYAPPGVRADYSLSLRDYPSNDPDQHRPFPVVGFAQNPPLFSNDQFVLRRIVWPRRYDGYADTSSERLIEP